MVEQLFANRLTRQAGFPVGNPQDIIITDVME
jgi:hypothetical protein